jgi:hypothetical protein
MTLMVVSLVLFVAAAVLGILSFIRRAGGSQPSRAMGYVHGVLATIGLILVVVGSALHSWSGPEWAFRLFVVAAIMGYVFFGIERARKKGPAWLGLVHGIVALAGLVVLLLYASAGAGA